MTYSLNPVGDSRLVGRYVLGGGLISYGLPVIGQKEFKIQEGNYVEWTGDLMNPKMNIVAAESISANVTDDSQNSRLVNFQAMIKVDGSLEKPEVVFGDIPTSQVQEIIDFTKTSKPFFLRISQIPIKRTIIQ